MQNMRRTERPFRFILPKKGRLKDSFADITARADLKLLKENPRQDFGILVDTRKEMDPFETLFQRADDALENLIAGLADMAVVGRDRYEEAKARLDSKFNLSIAGTFNLSACALWIAAPENLSVKEATNLQGLRIVTSYPCTLAKWLQDNGVKNALIIARDGGVEDYVRLGLADAVCDVVESGGTLAANGLRKTLKLFDSTAVLVMRDDRGSEWNETAQNLRARLMAQNVPSENRPASLTITRSFDAA